MRSLPTVRRVSDCPSSPALAAVVHRPAGGSLPAIVTPLGGRGGLSNRAAASQNPGFAAPALARLSFCGGGGAPAKKLRKTRIFARPCRQPLNVSTPFEFSRAPERGRGSLGGARTAPWALPATVTDSSHRVPSSEGGRAAASSAAGRPSFFRLPVGPLFGGTWKQLYFT